MNTGVTPDEEQLAPEERVAAEVVAKATTEQLVIITKACKDVLQKKLHPSEFLNILMVDPEAFAKCKDDFPSLDGDAVIDNTTRRWAWSIAQAVNNLMTGNLFSETVSRPESLWRQTVDTGEQELGAGRPVLARAAPGEMLSGDRAIMRARALLGLGAVVQVPLWHTGLWVTIKAPTEQSLLELDRRIGEEKVLLGRVTNGLVFSNNSVYISSYLVNFCLSHLADVSYRDINAEALKGLIKVTDIPILVWGMLCAIYPSGYPLAQPCVNNPKTCNHVTEELLNISKLCWTDNRSLSEFQRTMMTRRNVKFSDEELARYQTEHRRGGPLRVKINDNLEMSLRVPTIAEYEQSGYDWVDGIEKMVEGSFAVSMRGQERENYIIEQSRATALRQFSHWVGIIHLGEDNAVDDRDTVESLMATFSGDDDIYTSTLKEIGKYIESSTISLIAIPKYDCPVCHTTQHGDTAVHEHLIPLEVTRVFFTLTSQRLQRLLTRQ